MRGLVDQKEFSSPFDLFYRGKQGTLASGCLDAGGTLRAVWGAGLHTKHWPMTRFHAHGCSIRLWCKLKPKAKSVSFAWLSVCD